MDADIETEILSRLISGQPLSGLGLGLKNGRFDLSGLTVPEPGVARQLSTKIADVAVLSGTTKIKGATWKSLDFTGSRLGNLRLFDSAISDCIFDRCSCYNWGLWGTTLSDCSFHSVDLRRSALGGVQEGRRNSFRRVDFTAADLRQTAYTAAEFVGCAFKNSRMDKIDFQTSTFADCIFEGELREVLFYRRGFKGEGFPPNEMAGIDFRHAKLRWVEFRGLNLENVQFPEDADHIVLSNYPETLDRLLHALKDRTDIASRRLTAVLRNKRKWAGPQQQRGVLNKGDLLEICGGEEHLDSFLQVLKEHGDQRQVEKS